MPEHDGHIELERSIDSIVIGYRSRQDPSEEIDLLKESIKRLGLLQPITITPDGVLVCGARRLEAVRQLGWRNVKVWVRSGISDELSQLLAQQDENEQRKPLTPLEQAHLYNELHCIFAAEAHRRQESTRFKTDETDSEVDGAGDAPAPAPERGHGDTRHQAAVAVTGRASYQYLERISAIEKIAADRTLPTTVRKVATAELEAIEKGADVRPAYLRVIAAKNLVAVPDEAVDAAPKTREEINALSGYAATKAPPRPEGSSARRSLRAFLLTWRELDGWSRFFNPADIANQIKDEDWAIFERVMAETITFADEVRAFRSREASGRALSVVS